MDIIKIFYFLNSYYQDENFNILICKHIMFINSKI